MIEAKNINYHYRGGRQVLKDICFSAKDGDFMAILGNNGVGKSTLMKCLNRILTADAGSFTINDESVLNMSHGEIAKRIAFVAQSVPNTQMTVHDAMMLGRKPFMKFSFTEEDHMIVHEVMRQLGIEELRGRFLSELSGGERQKVMLGRAFVQQPKLLLLDEPTSSLDIKNQHQVLRIVKDFCQGEGKTAIVVIHDLNLALNYCDRFLFIKEGRVYACGDISVVTCSTLYDVYGIDADVDFYNGQYLVTVKS